MSSVLFWLYAFLCLFCLFSVSSVFIPLCFSLCFPSLPHLSFSLPSRLTCSLSCHKCVCTFVLYCLLLCLPLWYVWILISYLFIWFELCFSVALCLALLFATLFLVLDTFLFFLVLLVFVYFSICKLKLAFCFPHFVPPVYGLHPNISTFPLLSNVKCAHFLNLVIYFSSRMWHTGQQYMVTDAGDSLLF